MSDYLCGGEYYDLICCTFCLLQKKIKLPVVNRKYAETIWENEEAENETKDVDDNETKKPSKKKKPLPIDIFKDERFKVMFENKV